MSLRPLPTIEAGPLLRETDAALIPLLRDLEPSDWQRPAVGVWSVRDVAAHLLDGSLRRLSLDRDGHVPPAPGRDLSAYAELVSYLNELNRSWVEAAGRLSPEVITDLLAHACPQVADYLESLDPEGEAAFPVSWAAEANSKVWMDVAREFTERWHHQQQIREAVGAPGLEEERYVRPLLETLIRALPRSYAALVTAPGTRIEIRITDLADLAWVLERGAGRWWLGLYDGAGEFATTLEIPAATAWRLFTKAIDGSTARRSATVSGDDTLSGPFFTTLAIMA